MKNLVCYIAGKIIARFKAISPLANSSRLIAQVTTLPLTILRYLIQTVPPLSVWGSEITGNRFVIGTNPIVISRATVQPGKLH